MKANISSKARLLARASLPAALFVMLGGCPPTSPNTNSNEKLGFPTTAAAVIVDGVANEPAWSSSFKFFLEDGASMSAALMRGMADGNAVYLYFEAEDTAFDIYDAVVLAFNPSNAAGDYKRLQIYPCHLQGGGGCPGMGGSVVGGLNPIVESQTGVLMGTSVNWNGPLATGGPPSGMEIKSNVAPNGMANRWSVEIKIPRNPTYNFPATNYFGLFADVVATDVPMGEADQYTWPAGTFIGGDENNVFNTIQGALLPLARWGNGTLDPSQFPTGLQVIGFSNNGADPTAISLTGQNDFFGTAANYPAGAGPDATNVTATFKINNIGLNPSWTWTNIPVTNNPTAPGQTIHAREYMVFSPDPWTLLTTGNYQGTGMSERAWFTAHPSQCVMVELNHSGGTTSRYFNMHFVNVNSPFEVNPQISTGAWRKNYETARGVALREVFLNAGTDFKWQSRFEGAQPAGEHRWVIPSLEGQSQMLRTSVLPSDTLRLPSQDFDIDPVAMSQGRRIDIPVRPGSVITLLAEGQGKIGEHAVSPAGMNAEAAKRAQMDTRGVPDALRNGSATRPGALLGSFDGFRTAFAIGSGSTVFVPPDAQTLQVGFAGGARFNGGRYRLSAIPTEANAVALDGRSAESMRGAKGGMLLGLGSNLPMHIVRGFLDTGKGISIHGKRFRAHVPMGSYGSIVRSIRGQVVGGGGQLQPTAASSPTLSSATLKAKPR